MDEQGLIRRAVELALENVREGRGGPFGAVVARDGVILAEGTNLVSARSDPTAHAEVVAIRAASAALGTHVLSGCALYASCEPCPMCLAGSYWARLDRLVYAAGRADAAGAGFDDEAVYAEVALPPERRALASVQLPVEGALAPFEAWARSETKVLY